MRIDYNKVAHLNAFTRAFCLNHGGWIVGSGARYLLGLSNTPNDWDILVPLRYWPEACRIVPRGTLTNSLGGFKILSPSLNIDVWPGDIGEFFSQVPEYPAYAVSPKYMRFLVVHKEILG